MDLEDLLGSLGTGLDVADGLGPSLRLILKCTLDRAETPRMIRQLGGDESERVVLQKFGKYWNQQQRLDRPDGLFVVTTHRLLFLSKADKAWHLKTDFLSFPYEMIDGIEYKKVWLKVPSIWFRVEGGTYAFTFLKNGEEVRRAVDSVLGGAR